jgi:hypothetical protein
MVNNLTNNMKPFLVAFNATVNASAALPSIDLLNTMDKVEFLVHFPTVTALSAVNKVTYTIEESDDNATWTPLADSQQYVTPKNRSTFNPQPVTPMPLGTDLYGSGPFVADAGVVANALHFFTYRAGVKRYVRLNLTAAGAPNYTHSVYAFAKPRNMPQPTTTVVS